MRFPRTLAAQVCTPALWRSLIWSPVKQVDLGIEFLWGQRRNRNDQSGHALRLQFSAQYKF